MKTHDYNFYYFFKEMLILKRAILISIIFINLFFIRNVDAQCGNALEFDASNLSYVVSGMNSDVSNDFTMEFWVKPSKLIKTGMVETVAINNDYTGTSGQNYAIYPSWYPPPPPLVPDYWSWSGIYNIGGHAGAGVSVGTNGIAIIEHSAWYMPVILLYYTPVSSSVWTHIAVVYTNKTPSLYINGSWVRTGVMSLKDFIHPSALLGDEVGYGPFDGTIDEFRIWDVALSAATISNWYDVSVTSSHPDYVNLSTWLRFNEGSGSLTLDASGNGHHGTLVNSPTWTSGWWPEGATNPTVDAGPDISTFFGINSMQSVTRTATVSGGTPPYNFTWSLGRPLLCNQENSSGDESFYGGTCSNNSCPDIGNPTETATCSGNETITAVLLDTTTVCVTVTDADGCTGTDCFIINASDVRCFAGNGGAHKVKMCHHTNSNGNPWVEICVDTNAIDSHLAHGDYLGTCDINKTISYDVDPGPGLHFNLFPNPATNRVTLEFGSSTEISYIIELTDMMGRKLIGYQGKAIVGENKSEIALAGINRGIYLVKLALDGKLEVKKLVID